MAENILGYHIKHHNYFENYYFNNLSLGEMAENYGVSRNAIHKQLKIVEERLKYYEENLELLEKSKKAEELVQKINDKKLRDEILELF